MPGTCEAMTGRAAGLAGGPGLPDLSQQSGNRVGLSGLFVIIP